MPVSLARILAVPCAFSGKMLFVVISPARPKSSAKASATACSMRGVGGGGFFLLIWDISLIGCSWFVEIVNGQESMGWCRIALFGILAVMAAAAFFAV